MDCAAIRLPENEFNDATEFAGVGGIILVFRFKRLITALRVDSLL